MGNKGEVQDNAITEMFHKKICTSLFKHFQEMSVKLTRIVGNSYYPNPNELDQILFQSAATLTGFYCRIINLMFRPYENVPSDIHNDNSIVK